MNKKLCILLVLAVLCAAVSAGNSKEKSKEKSKESGEKSKESEEKSKESGEKSKESSAEEVPPTEEPASTTPTATDRCAGQADGTLFPSLTSCANFVTCQGETEGPEATCVPSGTMYDSSRKVCDYEPNVVCAVEAETTTGVSEETTEAVTTAPEPTQQELKGMCKGVVISMIPHPGNCNKYIICVLGKPTIQSCGQNMVFYSDISLCAFGDPKKC